MHSGYQFRKYKSTDAAAAKKSATEAPLHLVCETRTVPHQKELEAALLETRWTVEAVNLARDLSNEPSNIAHPEFIAKQARDLAFISPAYTCDVRARLSEASAGRLRADRGHELADAAAQGVDGAGEVRLGAGHGVTLAAIRSTISRKCAACCEGRPLG